MSTAVLGIDTATDSTCVAITRSGAPVCERTLHPPDAESGRPGHAAQLLPAIEQCLREVGGWDALGTIGVGIGPGSYTGLRIGISTARMLGLARGIDLVPVCTLDALAVGITESGFAADKSRLAVLDGRRNEAFVGAYGPDGEQLGGPLVLARERLGEAVEGLGESPLAAGDGALRFRAELEAAGAVVPAADEPVHELAARHVCSLAGSAVAVPPEAIEPIYLREPDARRWRERDGADE